MSTRMSHRPAWGMYVAVAIAVAAVVLVVTLPTMLCQGDTGSVVAGDSAGGATRLKEALARVAQLEEQNLLLRAQVAQQQEQLGDLQITSERLQLENMRLQKQFQGTSSKVLDVSWFWILLILAVLVWKRFC